MKTVYDLYLKNHIAWSLVSADDPHWFVIHSRDSSRANFNLALSPKPRQAKPLPGTVTVCSVLWFLWAGVWTGDFSFYFKAKQNEKLIICYGTFWSISYCCYLLFFLNHIVIAACCSFWTTFFGTVVWPEIGGGQHHMLAVIILWVAYIYICSVSSNSSLFRILNRCGDEEETICLYLYFLSISTWLVPFFHLFLKSALNLMFCFICESSLRSYNMWLFYLVHTYPFKTHSSWGR